MPSALVNLNADTAKNDSLAKLVGMGLGICTNFISAEWAPRQRRRIESGIERLRPADRHAHTVQRHRIVGADPREHTVRRPARTHVVLGVNLEEHVFEFVLKNRGEVFVLDGLNCNPTFSW